MMTRDTLKDFLDGNISSAEVIECIRNKRFKLKPSTSSVLNTNEDNDIQKDFVPNFLDYLRAKLSSYLSPQQAASCSPKRQLRSKKNKKKQENKTRGSRTSLFTRYSPESQSDTSRSFDTSDKFSRSYDNNALPKRNSFQSPNDYARVNKSRKPKRVELSPTTNQLTPISKHKESNLNGKLSKKYTNNLQINKIPGQDINQNTLKKRITPTLITQDKDTFNENEETKMLFDSSPILEVSESSVDSDGSLSQSAANDKKIKKLEKKMRKIQKSDGKKMHLATFLAVESSNTLPNKEDSKPSPCTPFTADVHKVYKQRLVSSPIYVGASEEVDNSQGTADIEFQSSIEERNEIIQDIEFSMDSITNKDKITAFVDLYECILKENLMTNITLELYFLFGVLNCKIEDNDKSYSEDTFSSAPNCIYFAAEVLKRIKNLLVFLDRNSLRLMSENPRLKLLAPCVIDFANEYLLEITNSKSDTINITGHSKSLGIPFQIELNNRKSFMSDRYFYSFSKLRDRFYGLVRIWEENHFNQEWNIDVEMGKEFHEFFQESSEFPTFAQFSELFVSQLLEMCKQDFSTLVNRDDPSMSTSLPAYLRGTDPAKLQLLQERFVMPLMSRGPCPKPYFTDVEAFFQAFIKTVDSYQFTVHLTKVLVCKLQEINSRNVLNGVTEGVDMDENELLSGLRDVFTTQLSEARILAKFLGYVIFLPYANDSKSRKTDDETQAKVIVKQPFNPKELLCHAIRNGHLIFTVSWLVIYLSMMDIISLKLKVNSEVFQLLVVIYRQKSYRMNQETVLLNTFFVIVQLGWLFEQPSIAAGIPLYNMMLENECLSPKTVEGDVLDDYQIINKSVLYRFCPYLSELKLALTYAGAKNYRKIKPITRIEKTQDFAEEKKLKDKLIENFLKYQPKFIKDSIDFIHERFFANLKVHITSDKLPEMVKLTMASLEKDIVYNSEGILEIEEMRKTNTLQYQKALMSSKKMLDAAVHEESAVYCENKAHKAVAAILPPDTHHKVVQTVAKIITNEVKCKVAEWKTSKLMSTYEHELQVSYNRHLMSILKKHNKSFNSV